jgi:hypothetical protein
MFPFQIKIKQNNTPKNRIAGLSLILRCLTGRQPISNHRNQGGRILSKQAVLRLMTEEDAAAGVRTIRRHESGVKGIECSNFHARAL